MSSVVHPHPPSLMASAGGADKELRLAKEALGTLSYLASQAEQGAQGVDFEKARCMLAECNESLQQLSQGAVPQRDPQTNAIVPATPYTHQPAGGTAYAYARSGAGASVSDMQRRRAQQALSELRLVETSLRQSERRAQQRQSYAAQRESLLGGGLGREQAELSEVEYLQRERESLDYTRRRVQQMHAESADVLRALQDQGRRIGGTGEKLGDLLESLGISNTTLLQIVRRNQVDAWLVYGGIVLLLFLMCYLLW